MSAFLSRLEANRYFSDLNARTTPCFLSSLKGIGEMPKSADEITFDPKPLKTGEGCTSSSPTPAVSKITFPAFAMRPKQGIGLQAKDARPGLGSGRKCSHACGLRSQRSDDHEGDPSR